MKRRLRPGVQTVGQRALSAYLGRPGTSVTELARRCGVTKSAICHLTSGRREQPTLETALALAEHAGIGLTTWFDEYDPTKCTPVHAASRRTEVEGDDDMKPNAVMQALSKVLADPKATDGEKREAKRLLEEQLRATEENPTGSPTSPRSEPSARPSNPYGLTSAEKDELDRKMGMTKPITKTHEVLPDGRLVIHTVRPSDWRRIEDDERRRAAAGPQRFGPLTTFGAR